MIWMASTAVDGPFVRPVITATAPVKRRVVMARMRSVNLKGG